MSVLSSLGRAMRPALVIGLSGLLALGACASDSDEPEVSAPTGTSGKEGTSGEDAQDALPPCAEVWRTGETLDSDYAGCEREGEAVRGERLACSSGQVFYTFADTHYAVVGGLVREVQGDIESDPAYRKAVRSCRA